MPNTQSALPHVVVLIEMIYLIYEDYKTKIDKLVEVANSLKLEVDELKATLYLDILTSIPFNSTKAKAPEASTGPTTYPPPAISSLSTVTPPWATVARKGRKKSTAPSKASVTAKSLSLLIPNLLPKKDPTPGSTDFSSRERACLSIQQYWL
ncbi:hypothetical protein HOY80DRAFT_1040531 [Tuber brumale]|nr:hypothetical protein HOY80DRAFT_1040531 [Tuber brumale]